MKPAHYYIRKAHRDIGFFLIGMTMVYALSGISLLYRRTDFEPPVWLRNLNFFHKMVSTDAMHWVAIAYGVSLLFLAISSFWMYPVRSALFKRGLIIAGAGLLITIGLIVLA